MRFNRNSGYAADSRLFTKSAEFVEKNILNISGVATGHAFHHLSHISAKVVEFFRHSDTLFFMGLCGCSNFCIIKTKK